MKALFDAFVILESSLRSDHDGRAGFLEGRLLLEEVGEAGVGGEVGGH